MKWEMAKWKDVLTIVNGKSQKKVVNSKGKYPIYGSGGIIGYADNFLCNENSVIIGRKGSINNPIFVKEKFWNVDTAFGLIANPQLLSPKYLYYFCITFNFEKLNTTVTIPSLTKTNLMNIKIPLPPIKTQKRIVALLDRAQALIDKRKEQIALMDQLIQSIFYDMFGDPVLNPMGWEVRELSEFSEIKSGVTKGRKFYGKETIFVPYMRVANVQDGYLDLSELSVIEILPSDLTKYQLQKNDLLLTEGGDPDKLGRGAIWHGEIKKCIHQNHIFRIRLSPDIMIPEYASALVGSARGKRYFLKSAKQTTGIASINMTQLKKCPMLIPPIFLQNNYADRVKKIESQKQIMTTALKELENNFNSLMQRAFKGEI
jgi:type I restriction enzyme S subunit